MCYHKFPDSSVGKESACNAGDPSLIPGLGRPPWRRVRLPTAVFLGFPCGSDDKESTCNTGDLSLIPGLGRSPGEGKGYSFQYSGLENCKESDMTELVMSQIICQWTYYIIILVKFNGYSHTFAHLSVSCDHFKWVVP